MSGAAEWLLFILVAVFGGLLYYVYDGYLRVLQLLVAFRRRSDMVVELGAPSGLHAVPAGEQLPTVSVVIAVHDEAHQVEARVRNILDQDYPKDRLEVVIASDGSTDDIASVITARFGSGVRVVADDRRVGKSMIQNAALETVRSSIVLFSDADTRFEPGFLAAVVAPFGVESVGAVQAHLLFVDDDASTTGQGRYWCSELEIRQLEARLGILAVTSGACVAVRRELWKPIDPRIGEDCIIPLDVVVEGSTVAYARDAVALELSERDLEHVVRTRARMTLRNWQGTWMHPTLLNPLAHPGYAFALWSHKLLRWLSPVFLIGLSVCAMALAMISPRSALVVPALGALAFWTCAAVGAVASRGPRRVAVCTAVYTFVLANVGFLWGLVKAARGETITTYR